MWRYPVTAWLLLVVSLPSLAAAEAIACRDQHLAVEMQSAPLREEICSAAAQALRFLDAYGLHANRPIVIHTVDHALHSEGHPVYGSYDARTDRVEVMSWDSIVRGIRSPSVYDEPLEDELYGSVIAHEVAHAVMQHNSGASPLTATAQEYLAHATQLGVLSEALRSRIIARANVGAWESGDVVSDAYMAMAPTRFAVKCYLHLAAHPDPRAFVRKLLTAKWRYINID